MGCFGYVCKGCNTSIRGNCFKGGESAVLIHVREGKEIGRCEGHYNEYGTTIEENKIVGFRNDNGIGANSHEELCKSEFSCDSNSGIVAWHSACYKKATTEEQNNLASSEQDIDQSWGEVRKKFK
ncbi:hypothetical protein [Clostridium estertheticum]|uniref:hypothetical protein n=1 Tax=Clostridium estertheticum TaxID=238834 RepID=UPI001C0E62DF|nr:hypothetical protein [Clostridium estertheticum]MBU3186556.1 hypothetical protein [Clostridium estertheticum]